MWLFLQVAYFQIELENLLVLISKMNEVALLLIMDKNFLFNGKIFFVGLWHSGWPPGSSGVNFFLLCF